MSDAETFEEWRERTGASREEELLAELPGPGLHLVVGVLGALSHPGPRLGTVLLVILVAHLVVAQKLRRRLAAGARVTDRPVVLGRALMAALVLTGLTAVAWGDRSVLLVVALVAVFLLVDLRWGPFSRSRPALRRS